MTQNYYIRWDIEVEASSAEDAAWKALEIQRDPESIATVFDTYAEDGEHKRVDLEECK